jgi:hypothetical protein
MLGSKRRGVGKRLCVVETGLCADIGECYSIGVLAKRTRVRPMSQRESGYKRKERGAASSCPNKDRNLHIT